ncbi:hypothetical protein GCM10023162_21780 [Klenkia terrae]
MVPAGAADEITGAAGPADAGPSPNEVAAARLGSAVASAEAVREVVSRSAPAVSAITATRPSVSGSTAPLPGEPAASRAAPRNSSCAVRPANASTCKRVSVCIGRVPAASTAGWVGLTVP